jgi:HEAT repeat protein
MKRRLVHAVLVPLRLACFASVLSAQAAADSREAVTPATATGLRADAGASETASEVRTATTRSPVAAAILQSLQRGQLHAPADLLSAVRLLVRIEHDELARQYLARLQQSAPDASQLIALHEQFGSAFFLQLSARAALRPEGPALAQAVFAAVNRFRRDPDGLAQTVPRLGDPSATVRRAARAELIEMGAEAVPLLLTVLRDAERAEFRPDLREAVQAIGPAAAEPLLAALSSPDRQLQAEAARGLGHVGTPQMAAYLLRPALSPDPRLRQAATRALARLRGDPAPVNRAAAIRLVRQKARQYYLGKAPYPADPDGFVSLWTWESARNNVVRSRLPAADAAAVVATRFARDGWLLSPTDTAARRLHVASRLQLEQQLTGLDETLRQSPGSAYAWARAAGPQAVDACLAEALQQGRNATAIAAAQVLAGTGDATLLQDSSGQPRALARALQSPDRRVRHAAARAIMQLDPRRAFPGASYLPEALGDLLAVSRSRQALIGHPDPGRAATLAGMLGELGYQCDVAASGNDLLARALAYPSYDFILIGDAIDSPGAGELVQHLRKDFRTADVPAALESREDRRALGRTRASLDPLLISFPRDADQRGLARLVADLIRLRGRDDVPPARRLDQADDALNWLLHLAGRADVYPWYDLRRVQSAVERVQHQPAFAERAGRLLQALDTPGPATPPRAQTT